MNRKILILAETLIVLSIFSALMVSSVAANRGQTKKEYVDYEFNAVLTDPVVTVGGDPPTNIIIEGYRPPSGVQSCVVTINGESYSYPEDFDYNENFRIEGNMITGEGTLEVITVLTFNLPGNPTLAEYLFGQVTGLGSGSMVLDGVFFVTGTKMFMKVEGGGTPLSTQAGGVDYALHIGAIKGWPFGE